MKKHQSLISIVVCFAMLVAVMLAGCGTSDPTESTNAARKTPGFWVEVLNMTRDITMVSVELTADPDAEGFGGVTELPVNLTDGDDTPVETMEYHKLYGYRVQGAAVDELLKQTDTIYLRFTCHTVDGDSFVESHIPLTREEIEQIPTEVKYSICVTMRQPIVEISRDPIPNPRK